jgi:hypothetical protein
LRDARGFRVALISDDLVNPGTDGLDGLAVLEAEGWGAIQLPPDSSSRTVSTALLEHIAEQVEEFLRNGYEVVVIGDHAGLEQALGARGIPPLPHARPASTDDIRAFLQGRSAPRSP